MDIILDVDGVIRNITRQLLLLYRDVYDNEFNITWENAKRYELEEIMPKVKSFKRELFLKYPEFIFQNAEPFYEGDVDCLWRLHKKGHKIHIASRQFKTTEQYTIKYLMDKKIPYDSISFTKDKWIVRGDLILEDCIANLESCQGRIEHLVCIARPWNEEWEGEYRPGAEDYSRAMPEFEKLVYKLEKKIKK